MSIVKETISAGIKQVIESTKTLGPQEAEQVFADQLADVIIQALLSADVNTVVSTTGTASAQAGTGIGKLS